ncbi:hypothetical protein EDF39_1126 [Frondihabitans sp. PhB161]|nr:hypothetical protein EDF37_1124 [Frondihabitans sp. PhB153]RPF08729.1 hypothetical protein EDF39_1126 [Frondihabitans sp. PhB161]
MFSGDPIFVILIAGAVVGVLLTVVGIVKTVRYQGWGKQTWAPPARPWLGAAAAVLVLTLVGGVIWATAG